MQRHPIPTGVSYDSLILWIGPTEHQNQDIVKLDAHPSGWFQWLKEQRIYQQSTLKNATALDDSSLDPPVDRPSFLFFMLHVHLKVPLNVSNPGLGSSDNLEKKENRMCYYSNYLYSFCCLFQRSKKLKYAYGARNLDKTHHNSHSIST